MEVKRNRQSVAQSASEEEMETDAQVQRRGKCHPPPPKPRPPSVQETPPPVSAVDLDCSTSEDEDTSVRRRALPRRSKKQKRAQKHQEVKDDRAVLVEMKNPIPSTSGPLVREQEKIKKMYPRKFLQTEVANSLTYKVSNVTDDQSSRPRGESESAEGGQKVKEETSKLRGGAMRKTTKAKPKNEVKKEEASATRSQSIRSSSRRSTRNSDAKNRSNIYCVNGGSQLSSAHKPKTTPKCDENAYASAGNNENAKTSPETEGFTFIFPNSSSHSSPPEIDPVLNEKRQRRLPKRLMSPDMADLPPVLFRIGSCGSINVADQDDKPPKLQPMIGPPIPRPKKHPGKENQLAESEKLRKTNVGNRAPPILDNYDSCIKIQEKKPGSNYEPARKRVARARSISASDLVISNENKTEKSPEMISAGPKLRNRSPSRRARNSPRNT